jgi:hypothetical protein
MEVKPVPSEILLFEPKKDPEVERALDRPGLHLWRASAMEEALNLIASHALTVVIVDTRDSHLNSWRAIAEIWETAKDKAIPPMLIFIDNDDVGSWNVNSFGPIRFSDQRHLAEVFREVLNAAHHASAPGLGEDAAWNTVRSTMRIRGNERFKVEQDRMRRLGILDERGRATSEEWPADMKPGSHTDIAT